MSHIRKFESSITLCNKNTGGENSKKIRTVRITHKYLGFAAVHLCFYKLAKSCIEIGLCLVNSSFIIKDIASSNSKLELISLEF